jgi:hypothetical protein
MNYFLAEWLIAMHKAAWFPLIWLLGLEATSVSLPQDMLPQIGDRDRLSLVGPTSTRRRAAASW